MTDASDNQPPWPRSSAACLAEARALWAAACAEECRRHLWRITAAAPSHEAVERTVRAVSDVLDRTSSPPTSSDVEHVRAALRQAVLAEVERDGRTIRARLRHHGPLNRGCPRIPRLLGKRADGRLSVEEVAFLYARLDRCPECSRLVGRFDSAEWQLRFTLSASWVTAVTAARVTAEIGPAALPASTAGQSQSVDPAAPEPVLASRTATGSARAAPSTSSASGSRARRFVRGTGRTPRPLPPLRSFILGLGAYLVLYLVVVGVVASHQGGVGSSRKSTARHGVPQPEVASRRSRSPETPGVPPETSAALVLGGH
jgi:hypothetical protein